jgi:hypothetical protein
MNTRGSEHHGSRATQEEHGVHRLAGDGRLEAAAPGRVPASAIQNSATSGLADGLAVVGPVSDHLPAYCAGSPAP